ncbi:MAG: hypothetical protein JF590_01680 [Gemmatimonadetes bacterium]|nr:hypothetical protein [Gemmatimonadota bacterium]
MTLPRRLRLSLLLLGVLSQAGCYSWQYDTAPVPAVLARKPNRVLVPVGADSFVVLIGAEVTDDSLVGLIEGSAEGGERLTRFAAPLADVPRVAREQLTFLRSTRQAGEKAGKAVVPVGNYLAQLAVLGGIVLGTIGFGTYIQGAGH